MKWLHGKKEKKALLFSSVNGSQGFIYLFSHFYSCYENFNWVLLRDGASWSLRMTSILDISPFQLFHNISGEERKRFPPSWPSGQKALHHRGIPDVPESLMKNGVLLVNGRCTAVRLNFHGWNPRFSRGFGRRMHLGVEVTESSTNKQHHLSVSSKAIPLETLASVIQSIYIDGLVRGTSMS
jgi:hypothetical protein